MAELLETERSYVKDLELTLKNFLGPMREAGESLPAALRGKVIIVITILIIIINLEVAELCQFRICDSGNFQHYLEVPAPHE